MFFKIDVPSKRKRTHKVHQRTVCFQYVVEIDFWFVSFYFIVYLIVVHSPWVYHQIFFSFSFLFLFLLPLERPPIGFGGGRRLCGIIMESSWENCPWKGLSEKKKKERKKNLVLFPILLGNIHQGTPAVWWADPFQPQSTH